jgi:hypothetical protein
LAGPTVAQSGERDEGEWTFVVSPLFVWGKSVDGTSTLAGSEAPVELDFQDDILENLDLSLTFRLEAQKGRFSYYAEYNFGRLEPESTGQIGPVEVSTEVTSEETMSEVGVFWAFSERQQSRLELLAAIRYFKEDLDVDFDKTAAGSNSTSSVGEISGGDSWWNGVLGARYRMQLSRSWTLTLRGDVGYGGEDNTSLQGVGLVNYRFNSWGSAFFGYRYLSIDFDNGRSGADGYAYDVEQQGPLLGLNIHF